MPTKTTEKTTKRTAKGSPPETGYEGGVVKEGTGDFTPGSKPDEGQRVVGRSVITQDKMGNDVRSEAGADGENPVTPQNPPRNAMLGGGRASESEGTDAAKAQNEDIDRS